MRITTYGSKSVPCLVIKEEWNWHSPADFGAAIVLTILLSIVSAGCNSKGTATKEAAPAVAAQPTQALPANARQPESPKLHLLDDDDEYKRLRKLSPYDLVESLPEYKDAVEKRQNLIREKVGNISDPALYQSLAAEASKSFPEINKRDYDAAAKAELQRRREAYAALHKDDFFIIGTYENYFPGAQKAIFNLRKSGTTEHAKDFAEHNFGSALAKHAVEFGGEKYDLTNFKNQAGNFAGVDEYFLVSEDRYKQDALEGCYVFQNDECAAALIVSISPQEMDATYSEVTNVMGAQMQKLYDEEVKAGGSHESYAHGKFLPYDPTSLKAVQSNIRAYVRRQSIWLLGKGNSLDPEKVIVREAYLAVRDKQFAKLK